MTKCLGPRIKELRLMADLSQEELGSRVGVQRAAIQKYEKGTVENIPLKTIEKIAKVFDVSPSYIVGWNGNIFKLYKIVLVLPNIKMNPPQVYMCSPS